ncbi:MAG: dTDP-4-amino-4,6-dideoxygalactose transaminase, partial [FCB group bacterium]|nr:dTDP-4-amino-4,6-dideoxygalactose transaminase [FCB group bacterium]
MIPFNKPYFTGNELQYMMQAVQSGKISGDGIFSEKCHAFFRDKFGFNRCFLTTSCTDALEMIALLLNIGPGDEVIIPSFSFVSLANAFVLRGASIIFIDSNDENPNIDVNQLEGLITPKTKVIAPIHYAGIAADLDRIAGFCREYDLFLIEDAAQAIDSKFRGKPLGSIGDMSAMSFHETKNIISGEGGLLIVNNEKYMERAEIIREKGTNRSKFFRGEIDKYGWIDIGSSYLPSDLIAAFLYAQLENIDLIQTRRAEIWNRYNDALKPLEGAGKLTLPYIP